MTKEHDQQQEFARVIDAADKLRAERRRHKIEQVLLVVVVVIILAMFAWWVRILSV
jgi:hypothetical protein